MNKFILFILVFSSFLSSAQVTDTSWILEERRELEYHRDTNVAVRGIYINYDSLGITDKPEFAWVKNIDSLLKNTRRQTEQAESPSIFSGLFNSPILQWLFWTVTAFVVFFILYKLVYAKGMFRFRRSDRVVESEDEIIEHTVDDYESLIAKASAKNDFRLAVKYHFLQTLQRLADTGNIEPGAGKTNMNYYRELPQHLKQGFSKLILNFEYIWYGEKPVDGDKYNMLKQDFITFQSQIN